MTPRNSPAEGHPEAGFTLVDVLVALALFSVLITVLMKNVQFGLKAWSSTSSNIEVLDRTIVVQDLLRRIIGGLYPMAIAESGGQPLIDLAGSRHAFTFLSNAPLVAGGAGRFRYTLFVEDRGARKNLVLAAAPELDRSEGQSTRARTVLLPDIGDASFSYLRVVSPRQAGEWAESWTRQTDLPRLVRIRVTFRDEERAWPDLLIAPRVTADVGCLYDSITMRCKGR